MPDDNMIFPRRFVGYGAYNLSFDQKLGQPTGGGQNFFEYIRAHPRWNPINLVRVVCFRQATIEDLPPIQYDGSGNPTAASRTQPLFRRDGTINPRFLDNLLTLVQTAKQHGFWVQVCLFWEQAVKADSGGTIEFPENVPPLLDPRKLGDTNCDRLTKFFNVLAASQDPKGPERLAAQRQLVGTICAKLRWETNVLWEIGNEIRIQGCSAADNSTRNCQTVPWLQTMSDQILSSIFWDHSPDGTSTADFNEHAIFDKVRPAGCNGVPEPYRPFFFDFHGGQWGQALTGTAYINGIKNAKARADGYRNQFSPPGTPPFPARLIINDDGIDFGEENPQQMQDHAVLIHAWAKTAFLNGADYASKQQYPPGRNWDVPALDALKDASNEAPLSS